MLGRLAKHLRMLGFDTAYERTVTEELLTDVLKKEQRILLTRTKNNFRYRLGAPCYFITSNDPAMQLKDVRMFFNIVLNDCNLFSRCLVCNSPLEKRDRSLVDGKVPDYVFNTVDSFSQCPDCKKIYWKGTHYTRMSNSIGRLFHD